MDNKKRHLALIGCGNMGGALLRGWLKRNIVASAAVLEPHGAPAGLDAPEVTFFPDAGSFAPAGMKADIVILAVKPQVMADVCASIAPAIRPDALVLSIAAGKTLAFFAPYFSPTQPLVRAMPNTPAAIGKGVTGLVAGPHVSGAQKVAATELLEAAGAVEWLDDEALIDPLTAISASGPAYLFYFIEALAAAGEKLGLPADMALRLARQMVIGSAALAEADGKTAPAQLRRNVTSPGGTTQAALDVLMDGRWQILLDEATASASRRAAELAA